MNEDNNERKLNVPLMMQICWKGNVISFGGKSMDSYNQSNIAIEPA